MKNTINRPDYHDYETIEDIPDHMLGWTVEPKLDGMWVTVVLKGTKGTLYSRTGRVKHTFDLPAKVRKTVLLGEYVVGTHWAKTSGLDGTLHLFDCLRMAGQACESLPLSDRRTLLQDAVLLSGLCQLDWVRAPYASAPIRWRASLRHHWATTVARDGFEGLVLKDPTAPYGAPWVRIKARTTEDYVVLGTCMGTGRNAGQVSALRAGLWVAGALVEIGTVAGLTNKQRMAITANPEGFIGKVFEASGMYRFPSGALRHPTFKCWREDKRPEECRI